MDAEPADLEETTILVDDQGIIKEMILDDYLLCVLLGEMPADFELEALKAQSVATRTYTLRKALKQNKHPGADICTDPSCCQAFISETDYLQSGGTEDSIVKMKEAIRSTSDEVITYQGNLIEATYFSCSGGKTEDAVSVWGTSVPYLKSVDSPGEENAKHFEDRFAFSIDTFCRQLGLSKDALNEDRLTITYTEGNGVDQLSIGNANFSGTQIRTLFSLPSTSFTISFTDEEVVITTRGYGHRVGMSQYGADAMAVEGKNYMEILAHYYPGTQLTKFASV